MKLQCKAYTVNRTHYKPSLQTAPESSRLQAHFSLDLLVTESRYFKIRILSSGFRVKFIKLAFCLTE